MPRFVIQRTLPPMTSEQLEEVRVTSTRVCNELGINWIRSHLTADGKHSFCEYEADSEQTIQRHSQLSGIPYDSITLLGMELGPSTVR